MSKNLILFLSVSILILFSSCEETKKDNSIPLENIDKKLRYVGKIKAEDILQSFKSEKGAMFLLDTEKNTPKIHGGIMSNREVYNKSYALIKMTLGELSEPELYKAVRKDYVTTLYYKLKSSEKNIKDVSLLVDINNDNNFAAYYLYALDDADVLKGKNLLPEITLR